MPIRARPSATLGGMKILVTASSKHGTTTEIADAIAERLRGAGFEVVRQAPQDVVDLNGIDAVIIGSAVYMTQWMEPAAAFLERFETQLNRIPVWAYSRWVCRASPSTARRTRRGSDRCCSRSTSCTTAPSPGATCPPS